MIGIIINKLKQDGSSAYRESVTQRRWTSMVVRRGKWDICHLGFSAYSNKP